MVPEQAQRRRGAAAGPGTGGVEEPEGGCLYCLGGRQGRCQCKQHPEGLGGRTDSQVHTHTQALLEPVVAARDVCQSLLIASPLASWVVSPLRRLFHRIYHK